MQLVDKITVALTTYRPLRKFPTDSYWESWEASWGRNERRTFFSGWLRSVEQLKMITEILVIEKKAVVDDGHRLKCEDSNPMLRVIESPNDPPYADPFRQKMLDAAQNDWVLILDDDERMSPQMAQFIGTLATSDPAPGKPWVAIRFPREDYIWHNNVWRYAPANGDDHQMRLVNRRHVRWGSGPHTIPEVDGAVLTIGDPRKSILHYRDFNKIVSWTDHCNEMFADQPHIIKMQTDYVDRLRQMLGVETEAQ